MTPLQNRLYDYAVLRLCNPKASFDAIMDALLTEAGF